MNRCEFTNGGCGVYGAVRDQELQRLGFGRWKIGSGLLSGLDTEKACKKAGLPCYDPNRVNASCYEDAQTAKEAQPEQGRILI